MLRHKVAVSLLTFSLLAPGYTTRAQTAVATSASTQAAAAKSVYKAPDEIIAKIKD